MLESNHIRQLIKANPGELNAALIACAAVWGLKAGELAQVTIGDILDSNGRFIRDWWLRPEIAFNGYGRKIPTTHKSLIKYLEQYLAARPHHKSGVLFLSPRTGEPFKFSGDRPIEINALFRDMFMRAGLSQYKYRDFRNALIIEIWRNSAGVTAVIKDIMERLGIRAYSAVDRVIKSDTKEIARNIKGIYKRL